MVTRDIVVVRNSNVVCLVPSDFADGLCEVIAFARRPVKQEGRPVWLNRLIAHREVVDLSGGRKGRLSGRNWCRRAGRVSLLKVILDAIVRPADGASSLWGYGSPASYTFADTAHRHGRSS